MTRHLAKKLGFGLLVLGLFMTGTADNAYAVKILGQAAGLGAVTQYGNMVANQKARTGEAVQDTLVKNRIIEKPSSQSDGSPAETSYKTSSGTIRAFDSNDTAKLQQQQKDNPVTFQQQASGAKAAAKARYNSANTAVGGALKAGWGAVKDGWNIATGNPEKVASDVRGQGNEAIDKAHGALQTNIDTNKALTNASMVYETADGQAIYMDRNMKSVSGMMEGCVPIPVKLDELKRCIFCPLFKILYVTAETMAVSSFDTLSISFKYLLLIGFALYITFITLKQVSAFTKQDAPKYITELLTITFKVGFAVLLLANGHAVYRYGLEPIIKAGLEMSGSFMFHQKAGGGDGVKCEYKINDNTSKPFYTEQLHENLDCFIQKVTQELAVLQSIGSSLMCVASHKNSALGVFPDLSMFSSGLVMWIFGWLSALSFAWYLIDQIIRLGIIGALLPFLIASWPFKVTSGYTSTGWKMFLTAFFTFAFMGLVVSVNVELAGQAATGGNGNAVDVLMNNINNNDVEAVFANFDIGFVGFIFMILCCVFGWKLCQDAASLASEFGQARSPGLGSQIGAIAGGAAKGAVKSGIGVAAGGARLIGDNVKIGDNTISGHLNNAADWGARVITAPANWLSDRITPGARAARKGFAANSTAKGGRGGPNGGPSGDNGGPGGGDSGGGATAENEAMNNTTAENTNSRMQESSVATQGGGTNREGTGGMTGTGGAHADVKPGASGGNASADSGVAAGRAEEAARAESQHQASPEEGQVTGSQSDKEEIDSQADSQVDEATKALMAAEEQEKQKADKHHRHGPHGGAAAAVAPQVAQENEKLKGENANLRNQNDQQAKQIAELEKKLDELRKKGDTQGVARIQQELNELKQKNRKS